MSNGATSEEVPVLLGEGAKCQICVDEELAIAYCKQCTRRLCDECLCFHKRQRDTAKHEIVMSSDAERIRNLNNCNEHAGKPLDYYCTVCEKPICDHCIKRACSAHKFLVASEVKEEIRKSQHKVGEKQWEFEQHTEVVKCVSEKNQSASAQCRGEINRVVNAAIQRLQSRKEEILHQLQETTEKNDKQVTEHSDFIEEKLGEMRESIESTERLLESKKDAKVIKNREETLANLDAVGALCWDRKQLRPRAWCLKEVTPLEHYVQEFGKLVPKPYPEDIVIDAIQLPVVGVKANFTVSAHLEEPTPDVEIKIASTSSSASQAEKITPEIMKIRSNKWLVSYLLRNTGEIKIWVSICGVEAKQSPFTLRANETKQLSRGMRVTRGPDWKWGEQDGGEGNKGEVIKVKGTSGWVIVKWQNGREQFDYRWGVQGAYDLTPV